MSQRKKSGLLPQLPLNQRNTDFLRDMNPQGEGRQAEGTPPDPSCAHIQIQCLIGKSHSFI